MDLLDILSQLATQGVRVRVSIDDATLLRFMAYGCAAAIVAGILTALVRKKLPS